MFLRATRIFCIFLFIFGSLAFRAFAQSVPWEEMKSDHFRVFYTGEDKFAKKVLRQAEKYYDQVSDDLGYRRYSDFWKWENRVKIYIYKDKEEFIKYTGRKEWSHGYANYSEKAIYSYEWKSGFLESLLPHEITHLTFRDYVGFAGQVPIWLDEGVAQWQEPEKRKIVREYMRYYLKDGKYYTIDGLTTTDVRNINNPLAVELFYVQAASVIDFLVNKYGADQFIFFCRQLRDGKMLEEALPFAYPTKIRTLDELEEQWRNYITETP